MTYTPTIIRLHSVIAMISRHQHTIDNMYLTEYHIVICSIIIVLSAPLRMVIPVSIAVTDPGFVKREGRESKCSDAAPGLKKPLSGGRGWGGGGVGDSDTFVPLLNYFEALHYGLGVPSAYQTDLWCKKHTHTQTKTHKHAEGAGGGGGAPIAPPPPGSATSSYIVSVSLI